MNLKLNTGDEAPIVTNESGGMQSKSEYRFDLIRPEFLFAIAEVLDYGAKRYAPNNWMKISSDDHYNHLMVHLNAYALGDTSEEHLSHAACRLMFLFYTSTEDQMRLIREAAKTVDLGISAHTVDL